jgi:hypothetical protein
MTKQTFFALEAHTNLTLPTHLTSITAWPTELLPQLLSPAVEQTLEGQAFRKKRQRLNH